MPFLNVNYLVNFSGDQFAGVFVNDGSHTKACLNWRQFEIDWNVNPDLRTFTFTAGNVDTTLVVSYYPVDYTQAKSTAKFLSSISGFKYVVKVSGWNTDSCVSKDALNA